MKLDTANRTFLAVIAIATGAYVLAGIGACAVFSLVVYRVATDGFGVLTRGGVALQVGVLILALMGAGTIFGLRSVRSQLNSTERLMKSIRLRRISPSHEHLSAAVRARLGSRLYVVSAAEPFSFTFGLFFPKVVFSTGLASALSSAELDAVLTHERYHVRNFDPLKVLLARALGRAFFWLPLLRDLLRRYIAGRELAADRRAVRSHGDGPLAGALLKVVGGPDWADLTTAAAIGSPDLLELRVAQLEAGAEPTLGGVSRRAFWLSMLGLSAVVLGMSLALTGSGGPFAAMRRAMPARSSGVLMSVGMAFCGLLWGWIALRVARYLLALARPPLDTTHA